MKRPLVSTILTTYNRAEKIVRSIQTVLGQSYKNIELIVVDDASTDNTEKVVGDINDESMRYIKHRTNKGAQAARNSGLDASKGKYIAFLDDDDYWDERKIELQVKAFQEGPESVGVVYGQVARTHEWASNDNRKYVTEAWKEGEVLQDALRHELPAATTSSMLLKSSYLEKVLPLDERLPGCHDTDLKILLSRVCEFKLVDEVLTFKVEDADSISKSLDKAKGRDMVIEKHKKLYTQFPKSVKRHALGKHNFRYGIKLLKRGRKKSAIRKLLKSLYYKPSIFFTRFWKFAQKRVIASLYNRNGS